MSEHTETSEHTEMSLGQVGDRDKDSDKDAASTRRDTPEAIDNDPATAPSRQAEQESALQQWETEGGAEEDKARRQGRRGWTPDSVQDDGASGRASKEL